MPENKPKQEGRYDVLVNNNGELLIALKKKDGEPASSRILYDGKEHALFYRNPEDTIILDYIHPDARSHFAKAAKVIMVEFEKRRHHPRVRGPCADSQAGSNRSRYGKRIPIECRMRWLS